MGVKSWTKAEFIGEDGSMELRKHHVYPARIRIDLENHYFWVDWLDRSFRIKSCRYSNADKVSENWRSLEWPF